MQRDQKFSTVAGQLRHLSGGRQAFSEAALCAGLVRAHCIDFAYRNTLFVKHEIGIYQFQHWAIPIYRIDKIS